MDVPFFTNLQCDSALPWKKLIDELEVGLTQFSNGQIEQPVRAMLEVKKHSGFLGKINIIMSDLFFKEFRKKYLGIWFKSSIFFFNLDHTQLQLASGYIP